MNSLLFTHLASEYVVVAFNKPFFFCSTCSSSSSIVIWALRVNPTSVSLDLFLKNNITNRNNKRRTWDASTKLTAHGYFTVFYGGTMRTPMKYSKVTKSWAFYGEYDANTGLAIVVAINFCDWLRWQQLPCLKWMRFDCLLAMKCPLTIYTTTVVFVNCFIVISFVRRCVEKVIRALQRLKQVCTFALVWIYIEIEHICQDNVEEHRQAS